MAKGRLVFFLGLAIPALFVFRPLIFSGPVVWGDAPYFYHEALRELVSEPFTWTSWGNNFGGINVTLWLSPIMILYGALHQLFGLNNDVILRILFYFPAVFFAIMSPLLFTRYLRFGRPVQFFTSLLYILNTYFLLLIDGGQVGVALAYGIFPLTLLFLRKLIETATLKTFLLALLAISLLTLADPRIAAICLVSLVLWIVVDGTLQRQLDVVRNLRFLIPLSLVLVVINTYWIFPVLKFSSGIDRAGFGQSFLTMIHSLFLFQPHWPGNEFGRVSNPPLYFVGIPILIFGGLLFSQRKRTPVFAFCFLLFAFFTKGDGLPLGDWYRWFVENIPFGFAFRDSTKFFAPLILFGGILIGTTIQNLAARLGRYRKIAIGALYLYLLFLIHPTFLGQLSGVLSGRTLASDFWLLSQNLVQEQGFFRTVWFPERHPFGFHTEEKSAIDAKDLVKVRPLASLNVGTFDRFNFLHNEQFVDWFRLLGIRHLIFSGEQRKSLSQEERADWGVLLNLAAANSELKKENWYSNFPTYSIEGVKPKIFGVDKLIAVVGSEDIYQKLKDADGNFSVGNQAFVFFEDGKFNPSLLANVKPDSTILVLNNKTDLDLTMSFLQKHFISPLDATKGVNGPSRWALRSSNDYLKWKYEFLINNVDTREFDYGKGMAFSSIANEWIYFDVPVPRTGEYVFAARVLTRDKREPLEVNIFYGQPIQFTREGKFEWYIQEGITLKKGKKRIAFLNNAGFHGLNTLALIPKKDWEEAGKLTEDFLGHHQVVRIDGQNDNQELQELAKVSNWREIRYKFVNPTQYEIEPQQNSWIVFTDSYHPEWKLKKGDKYLASFPLYSAINGFYIDAFSKNVILEFSGQRYARGGLFVSLASVLLLALGALWAYSRKRNT